MGLVFEPEEDVEEAEWSGLGESRGVPKSQPPCSAVQGLKVATLCILALAIAGLFLSGPSSKQTSRFRPDLLAEYEKGHHESQKSAPPQMDVGPASLLWQCFSGSVPTACSTSFASSFVCLLICAFLCFCLMMMNFSKLGPVSGEHAQVNEELRLIGHLSFSTHHMNSREPDHDAKQRMQRSWDVSSSRENLQILEQLSKIMKRHPAFRFRLKGISYGNGEISQRTESAFYEDFHSSFPQERMDWLQPYAHARALSLKRALNQRGVSDERLHTMVQAGEANTIVVEAFL